VTEEGPDEPLLIRTPDGEDYYKAFQLMCAGMQPMSACVRVGVSWNRVKSHLRLGGMWDIENQVPKYSKVMKITKEECYRKYGKPKT